jgi:hypothetical protein
MGVPPGTNEALAKAAVCAYLAINPDIVATLKGWRRKGPAPNSVADSRKNEWPKSPA